MKKLILPMIIVQCFCAQITFAQPSGILPYQDPLISIDERVEDLLGRMTLEEKIGQLNALLPFNDGKGL